MAFSSSKQLQKRTRIDDFSKFPLIPGHEAVGEIVAMGSKVTGFEKGDMIVADVGSEFHLPSVGPHSPRGVDRWKDQSSFWNRCTGSRSRPGASAVLREGCQQPAMLLGAPALPHGV